MDHSKLGRPTLTGHEKHSLSQEFQELSDFCASAPVNLDRILERMHGRGQALIILFLASPFMLPIPLPAVSILFGLLIMIFSFSLATGLPPYLPRRLRQRDLPHETLQKFSLAASRFFIRLETWLKPRWPRVIESPSFRIAACFCIGLSGLLLALPLPPGTNFPPAVAIVGLAIGLLESDGLALIVGFVLFALNLAFFAILGLLGFEAVNKLLHFDLLMQSVKGLLH